MHFFTVYSDLTKTARLKDTAAMFQIPLTHILVSEWHGFESKICGMMDAVQLIPDDHLVCFVDAYDVLFLEPMEIIRHKFEAYNCRILFSSEKNCFPGDNYHRYIHEGLTTGGTSYPFLNSGGFIGYKSDVWEMLCWKSRLCIREMCQNGGDQNYFTQYFLEFHRTKYIRLDTNQWIFQSMCALNYDETFVCRRGKICNKVLDTFPCILHFNGFGDMVVKKAINMSTGNLEPVLEVFMKMIVADDCCNIYYTYPYSEVEFCPHYVIK